MVLVTFWKGCMQSNSLHGLQVLVTRPSGQADNFCELLQHAGAIPRRLPLIEIERIELEEEQLRQLTHWQSEDQVIFTSRNAVKYAQAFISAYTETEQKPVVAAIGQATAQALRAQGIRVDITPAAPAGSETLLQHAALQEMAGKRVLLVKGEAGRGMLQQVLEERGATVESIDVYRRLKPDTRLANALAAITPHQVDLIIISSAEALHNLMLISRQGQLTWVTSKPLVIISQRLQETAHEYGFTNINVAADSSDDALLNACQQWQQHSNARMENN